MNESMIIGMDFPDPDVIRVNDTFYMVSTTMHFMPGGALLQSKDLVHWDLIGHVYDRLEDNERHRLEAGNIYGQGMWAPSLRYKDGTFYLCFSANDTKKTYLFTANHFEGPWERHEIEGFYHDSSLLFDDDGRIYIVYGNRQIYITELDVEMKGPKAGGLHRLLVEDLGDVRLGYEGSHIYKVNGKYYVFFIHWPSGEDGIRTQACYYGDDLEGAFVGKDIFQDDLGITHRGVAQGGIVDTPDGQWYTILFQDCGAVGRIPYLLPMEWVDDFPVVHKHVDSQQTMNGTTAITFESKPSIYTSDFMKEGHLHPYWEWNHQPDPKGWHLDLDAKLHLLIQDTVNNVTEARNCLTQRMAYPKAIAGVTLDGGGLKEGDYAGICALQGAYSLIGMTIEQGKRYLVHMVKAGKPSPMGRVTDTEPGTVLERIEWHEECAQLQMVGDFGEGKDTVSVYYKQGDTWRQLGEPIKHHFGLDHFVGCRFGLFAYGTEAIGGEAIFYDFYYNID